ncbi:MAG: hypothetical protein K2I15_11105, partial [Bacteroides sp.]|nr:hypothetical protein [Bacteroides sp.]
MLNLRFRSEKERGTIRVNKGTINGKTRNEKRETKNKKREGEKGKEKEKGNKGKEKERKREMGNGKCGRYIKKRGGMNNFPKKNVSFVVLT